MERTQFVGPFVVFFHCVPWRRPFSALGPAYATGGDDLRSREASQRFAIGEWQPTLGGPGERVTIGASHDRQGTPTLSARRRRVRTGMFEWPSESKVSQRTMFNIPKRQSNRSGTARTQLLFRALPRCLLWSGLEGGQMLGHTVGSVIHQLETADLRRA